MPCPHCKAEVAPNDVYCISCGARLVPIHQAETVLEGQRPVAVEAAEPSFSSVPGEGGRRWLLLVALVINLGLLAGSAWLVYAALVRYAERNQPSLSLGAPRLVRVAPRPAPDAVQPVKTPESHPPRTTARPPKPEVPAPSRSATAPGQRPGASGAAPAAPTPASRPGPVAAAPDGETDQLRAGLDAESVRMVVQHHLPQIRVCYDRALKQQDVLGGLVEIQFEVTSEGRVGSSSVHRNTTGHEGLGKCIAAVLATWRFPRPVGGDVVFIYPFLFSSGA